MVTATFRFYAELNDFLPPGLRQQTFLHHFNGDASVKDRIEAIGVPHPEVDLILANGQPVDFGYLVQHGDHIAVYPPFHSIDISAVTQVRPPRLAEPRFVLDGHLGRLANYLRMLGFDVLYRSDFTDEELAAISSQEDRILLTRDRGLLKRKEVMYGYCLRSLNTRRQVTEVLHRFDLLQEIAPFHRCLRCNGLLEPVAKQDVLEQLEPKTKRYFNEFYRCQDCGQIYWKGSHYDRMRRFVDDIMENGG
jgi:hypothetical protein